MSSDHDPWIGRKLSDGRYEVRKLLGRGGMAVAFLARDTRLETDVVIKVPHAALLTDAVIAQRFSREIRSLVNLEHPHVVRIIDVGEYERVPYLVMPYLAGGSLESRRPKKDGRNRPIKPEQLRGWLTDVAKALDFIHSQGFVHRDIKPDNILFDKHQNAYISDFGIAKAVGKQSEGQPSLSGLAILGTVGYMSPEVLLGDDYDGRTDQYALAATVWELLTGRTLFRGTTPAAIIVKQTTEPAPDVRNIRPSIPEGVAAAVMRGLERDPEKRFPNCRAFAEAVGLALKRKLSETGNSDQRDSAKPIGGDSTEDRPTAMEVTEPPEDRPTRKSGVVPPPLRSAARTEPQTAVDRPAVPRTRGSSAEPTQKITPANPAAIPPVPTQAGTASRTGTSGRRWVWWAVGGGLAFLAIVVTTVVFLIGKRDEKGDDNSKAIRQTKANLKQIGVALHEFHDANNCFPPGPVPPTPSGPGNGGATARKLSWRVHLLPYLGDEAKQLYRQFNLSEAWDSPTNRRLIDKIPSVFADPFGRVSGGKTRYVGPISGENGYRSGLAFTGDVQSLRMADFIDGLTYTIMVVEVAPSEAVIWTKPDEMRFRRSDPTRGLLESDSKGFYALFGDGEVRFIDKSTDPKAVWAIFTRNGSENVEFDTETGRVHLRSARYEPKYEEKKKVE